MRALTTTEGKLGAHAARDLVTAGTRHSQILGNASAIVIVDRDGEVIALGKMDGAAARSSQVATERATGTSPGGAAVVVEGVVVGTVGVGGGTTDEDRRIASAAVSDVLGKADEEIPAAVREYFGALRANDPDAFAACFAHGSVGHDPVGAPPLHGPDEVRSMLAGFLPTWGRFDGITEDEAFVSGNCVAVRWTGSGLSSGGSPVVWTGINTFLLTEDGLIETLYATFDAPSMTRQLEA